MRICDYNWVFFPCQITSQTLTIGILPISFVFYCQTTILLNALILYNQYMLTFPALAIAYLVRSFSFSASNLNHNKLLNTTIYVQRTATIRYIKCSFKKTRRTTTTSSNNHLRLLQVIIMKCQLLVCCTYPFPSDVLFSGLSWHHHAPFSA